MGHPLADDIAQRELFEVWIDQHQWTDALHDYKVRNSGSRKSRCFGQRLRAGATTTTSLDMLDQTVEFGAHDGMAGMAELGVILVALSRGA
jgi:hypothetical protein